MKAILILDEMPNNCYECPYCICNSEREFVCSTFFEYEIVTDEEWTKKRYSKCPLKPLPQKRMPKDNGKQGLLKLIEQCCDIGYNSCLDEILGEEQ